MRWACHRTTGHPVNEVSNPLKDDRKALHEDRGSVMPPVRVIVAGAEAAAAGKAELWCGDDLLALTFLYDGRLHLRLEPRADGQPWLIEAASLVLALDEAARRIEA
jgi:hypothetical protein